MNDPFHFIDEALVEHSLGEEGPQPILKKVPRAPRATAGTMGPPPPPSGENKKGPQPKQKGAKQSMPHSEPVPRCGKVTMLPRTPRPVQVVFIDEKVVPIWPQYSVAKELGETVVKLNAREGWFTSGHPLCQKQVQ